MSQGIEFRVGHRDHKVAEQFISTEPIGVSALSLDAPNLKFQGGACRSRPQGQVDVLVDPMTDRLVAPGYRTKDLNYADRYPLDLKLLRRFSQQADLVERVLDYQSEAATMLIPPYFYADSSDVVDLNIVLASLGEEKARSSGVGVRPVLAVSRVLLADLDYAKKIAFEYVARGVRGIELRLSPLGDENDGPLKIGSALAIVDVFHRAGLSTVLGLTAVVGQSAFALGLVESYSTGIGYREQTNYVSSLARQRRPAVQGKGGFGPTAGVYLPTAEITISKKLADELYRDTAIRSRLVCNLGNCERDIRGAVVDARPHYLHAKARLAEETLARPVRWRPAQEVSRLTRALEFRENMNRNFLETSPLKTNAAKALISEIERRIEHAQSA